MISFLLSIISFLVTLPMKAVTVGIKASKVAKKVKGTKEKSRDKKSLRDRLRLSNKKDKKDESKETNNVLDNARKIMIRTLKSLISLLRLSSLFLVIQGLIISIISLFALLFLVGGVASAVIFVMNTDNHYTYIADGNSDSTVNSNVSNGSNVVINGQPTGDALQDMANWYIANVNTYQQSTSGSGTGTRKGYTCDLLSNSTVYDDCTGFSAAYASLVSGKNVTAYGSKDLYSGGQSYIDAGWKRYTIAEIGGVSGLVSGDILVCNDKVDSNCKGHHAEVFISTNSSFGWGKIQGSFPSSSATFVDSATYSGYIDQGTSHRYGVIYRYVGNSN